MNKKNKVRSILSARNERVKVRFQSWAKNFRSLRFFALIPVTGKLNLSCIVKSSFSRLLCIKHQITYPYSVSYGQVYKHVKYPIFFPKTGAVSSPKLHREISRGIIYISVQNLMSVVTFLVSPITISV